MASPPQTRAERAERLGPYFDLQLALARRMAELTGTRPGEAALHHTNLHRRFGFGHETDPPHLAWAPFAEELDATSDPAGQVALAQRVFLESPDEVIPGPGRTLFGCFACDDEPTADGGVHIHFYNEDTDATGGPLASAKLAHRRGEMAALVAHVSATRAEASYIKGRSWLYHLAAYRRVFPPDYGASARPVPDEPVHLQGNSLWGQAIDSWERVRPQARDAILAALPTMDPQAPWRVFPLGVMRTRAPLDSFREFYGL